MKIGIVGNGVVGQATARSYLEHVKEVRCYDTDRLRRTHSLHETIACDIVFVCLPTPKHKDKDGIDTSIIESFFAPIARSTNNFVIKSTVSIGTTRRLADDYQLPNLCHSPEFLTARCALIDAQMPSRNVIGSPNAKDGLIVPNDGMRLLTKLYEKRFPGVDTYLMSSEESEALKLIQNSFFAVKVAFFNEVHRVCEEQKLDWSCIRDALLADGRIHPSHTIVPGPDGKFGFGGACLPKDLNALITYMDQIGIPSHVLHAAQWRNDKIDRKRTP
jgi:UDPglucose 6-dehydrogenase